MRFLPQVYQSRFMGEHVSHFPIRSVRPKKVLLPSRPVPGKQRGSLLARGIRSTSRIIGTTAGAGRFQPSASHKRLRGCGASQAGAPVTAQGALFQLSSFSPFPTKSPLDLHLQAYGFLHIRPKRQISRNHHHFAVRNDSNRILLPKLCPQRENNGTAFRSVSIVLFYAPVVKIFRGSLWDVFVNEHWPTGPRLKKASYKPLMDQKGLGRLARKRITFLLQNRKINCKSNFCMIDYLRFCAAGGGRGAERRVSTKPACPMGADGPGDQMRKLLCSKINHQEPPAGNGCGG